MVVETEEYFGYYPLILMLHINDYPSHVFELV